MFENFLMRPSLFGHLIGAILAKTDPVPDSVTLDDEILTILSDRVRITQDFVPSERAPHKNPEFFQSEGEFAIDRQPAVLLNRPLERCFEESF